MRLIPVFCSGVMVWCAVLFLAALEYQDGDLAGTAVALGAVAVATLMAFTVIRTMHRGRS